MTIVGFLLGLVFFWTLAHSEEVAFLVFVAAICTTLLELALLSDRDRD
jgi:hypothetical protein